MMVSCAAVMRMHLPSVSATTSCILLNTRSALTKQLKVLLGTSSGLCCDVLTMYAAVCLPSCKAPALLQPRVPDICSAEPGIEPDNIEDR
jgi:hypothetical protein